MTRCYILIDATPESHAPFFARNPIFQPWLHSYDNINDALQAISQITLPYSIEIYLARDNILDDGIPDANGQQRTLIQTFCDLETIHHLSIYSPNISIDLDKQIRSIMSDKRLLKEVLSVIDLHGYMCLEGVSYFAGEISRCIATREIHLTPNFQRNQDELMEYCRQTIAKREPILDTLRDQHSNKPSEQIS